LLIFVYNSFKKAYLTKREMMKDDWALVLSIVCSVTGVISMILTMAIALGFNRHMGRWVSERVSGMYTPDYGDGRRERRLRYE
jgi:hypothetical protein